MLQKDWIPWGQYSRGYVFRGNGTMTGLIRTVLVLMTTAVLLAGGALLLVMENFEISATRQVTLPFKHGTDRLEGDLWLPDGEGPHPVALLVHGDGPQDRTSSDGYNPLVNHLLSQGIGVFSWDKPGIGRSTGDWLNQSMADRADETLAALEVVAMQPEAKQGAIGLIGFSQGGWVLPEVALKSDAPAFQVIIGGAVTWADQSLYLTRKRLEREGVSAEEITRVIEQERVENEQAFGKGPNAADPQAPGREGFIARNYHADARPGLAALTKPFLALLGKEDLNVDTRESAQAYQKTLAQAGHPDFEIHLLDGATHSLFRAEDYNFQTPGAWTGEAQLLFMLEGRDAYVPGSLEILSGWIRRVTGAPALSR